jgi:hypothetical protein
MQFPLLDARVAKIGGNLGRGLPSFDMTKKEASVEIVLAIQGIGRCVCNQQYSVLCSTLTTVRSHGNHSKNLALPPLLSGWSNLEIERQVEADASTLTAEPPAPRQIECRETPSYFEQSL